MMLSACAALGELGFAEIAKEDVNVRDSVGGKSLWQLDSPQSVYVFEEKTVGKHLWCHVSTYVGKNPKTGWIRGDMLRFLSDEFYDIVDVIAGETYVIGLRSDGTVVVTQKNWSVSWWTDIVALAAGDFFLMGLRSDGRIAMPPGSQGWREQAQRLRAEGVQVVEGRVRMPAGGDDDPLDALLWGPGGKR